MRRTLDRLHRDERGMSFVFVGLGFMSFLAATTLAIDVGMFMTARSQAQTSADAAALSGAISLAFDDYSNRSASGPAVQSALAAGRTGQAQEALERAETRLLTRSTEASAAGTADSNPLVGQISEARRALGRRDTAAARQAINTAMAGGSDMGGSGSGSSSSMSR